MGQNLALNIAEKGFQISETSRSPANTPHATSSSHSEFISRSKVSIFWWDACHHPHWCFYEGSWCGFFWSGQNNIPIAAASPKSWQRFKNKIEMISRRVLKETDFSCSDGIAQNKARSDCFVCYIFFLLLV
ncbi:unnamed protein product [Brassica oleracea]